MILRAVEARDIAPLEAFLRAHLQTSMFMLGSLMQYGINGSAPNAMRFWIWGAGDIAAVIGVGNSGAVFVQAPVNSRKLWNEVAQILAGKRLTRLVGDAAQMGAVVDGLAISAGDIAQHCVEPGFVLALDDLAMPVVNDAVLLPINDGPLAQLIAWRTEYHKTVLATPAELAETAARGDFEVFAAQDSHRVLMESGAAVAMTGFNSTAGDVVQVGGVYTPPDLRGRGFARVALAMHLAEARTAGVTQAILFAANEAAAKTYRGIGFVPRGALATVVFKAAVEVAG